MGKGLFRPAFRISMASTISTTTSIGWWWSSTLRWPLMRMRLHSPVMRSTSSVTQLLRFVVAGVDVVVVVVIADGANSAATGDAVLLRRCGFGTASRANASSVSARFRPSRLGMLNWRWRTLKTISKAIRFLVVNLVVFYQSEMRLQFGGGRLGGVLNEPPAISHYYSNFHTHALYN